MKPLMRQNGGPALMVQVENEYGSFSACDQVYLQWLRDALKDGLGPDTQLFTTDPPSDLPCGVIPDVYPTVDFAPSKSVDGSFSAQMNYTGGKGPLVNSEYYPGWFSLWGDTAKPHLPTTQLTLDHLIQMYEKNASFSVYMIHGGTNFGFWNGAEHNGPLITSYDYFAPISEAGDVGPTGLAIRAYLLTQKDWPNQPQGIPADSLKKAYGAINLQKVAELHEFAANCQSSTYPMTFEALGHGFGFVSYVTSLPNCKGGTVAVQKISDWGYVFVDGQYVDYLKSGHTSIRIPATNCLNGSQLTILAENAGRINYETANFPKGLLSNVTLEGKALVGWSNCPIQMNEEFQTLVTEKLVRDGPVPNDPSLHGIFTGSFQVDVVADTFIDPSNWGKGILFINGFNMGRYWTIGPQITLYVPSPVLKQGTNTITIVELENDHFGCTTGCQMASVDSPKWTW